MRVPHEIAADRPEKALDYVTVTLFNKDANSFAFHIVSFLSPSYLFYFFVYFCLCDINIGSYAKIIRKRARCWKKVLRRRITAELNYLKTLQTSLTSLLYLLSSHLRYLYYNYNLGPNLSFISEILHFVFNAVFFRNSISRVQRAGTPTSSNSFSRSFSLSYPNL